jgi:hypothetical protein
MNIGYFPFKSTSDILELKGIEYEVKDKRYYWDESVYGTVIRWSESCILNERHYQIWPTFTDVTTKNLENQTGIHMAYAVDMLYYEGKLERSMKERQRILQEMTELLDDIKNDVEFRESSSDIAIKFQQGVKFSTELLCIDDVISEIQGYDIPSYKMIDNRI